MDDIDSKIHDLRAKSRKRWNDLDKLRRTVLDMAYELNPEGQRIAREIMDAVVRLKCHVGYEHFMREYELESGGEMPASAARSMAEERVAQAALGFAGFCCSPQMGLKKVKSSAA